MTPGHIGLAGVPLSVEGGEHGDYGDQYNSGRDKRYLNE